MDYQDIVDYATEHTWIDITYAKALKYVQKRRNYILDCIRSKLWEKYFYQTYYTDIVAWQNEYTLPVSSSTSGNVLNVRRVEVKQKSTDIYRKYIVWDDRDLQSTDYLEKANTWIYELRWLSIFLYPTPLESVTQWMFIEWVINLSDITVSSIELDIFWWHTELRQYIQLIADWLCADLFASNRQYDDKQIAENDYQTNINNMIRSISNRGNSIISEWLPVLDHYE